MQEILFLAYFAVIWLAINRLKIFKLNGNSELANYAWGISLLGAVFTYFLYSKVYAIDITKADTFKFFVDAKTIISFWNTNTNEVLGLFFGSYSLNEEVKLILESTQYWFRPYHYGDFNDNQLIIRLNMLLLPISAGNYFIHLLWFTFLGFVGLWLIVKRFFENFEITPNYLGLILFLIPNVFVWKSGVLKEPVLLFGLGLLLFNFLKYHKSILNYLLIALSLLILVQVKGYVLASLFPVLFLSTISPQKNLVLKSSILYSFLVLIIYMASKYQVFDLPHLIYQKQFDFYNVSEITDANSGFSTFKLQRSLTSIILNSPMALFNGIFRPLPWNCNTPLMWIATLENIFTFTALVYSFIKLDVKKNGSFTFLMLALLFSINLLIIVGLTTTVSGALVRYKMPATITLWLIILYNFSKVKNEKNSFLPLFWS